MMRVVMRGLMIVLALVLVVASAGTVLCERDCAAVGHAASSIAMPPMGVGASHCDGEQIDSSQHGNSGGSTKHGGAHLHSGIVATVGARVLISPAITFSAFAVASVDLGAALLASGDEHSWNSNSSPPIDFPSGFSSGVLRI
jgi:hypothetical protein